MTTIIEIVNYLCKALFDTAKYPTIVPVNSTEFSRECPLIQSYAIEDGKYDPVKIYTAVIGNLGPSAMAFNKEDVIVKYLCEQDSIRYRVHVNTNKVKTLLFNII